MKGFFGILALATASLLLSACSVAQVSNFKFDASPSPEVRGPGMDMATMDGVARVSASFVAADEDEVTFPVKSSTLDNLFNGRGGMTIGSLSLDSTGVIEGNNAILEIDGYHLSAAVDLMFKFNTLVLQFGFGAYDGFYYYASFGANYKFFEWGLFLGEFHQFTTVDYLGYWCGSSGCSEEDKDDSFKATEWLIMTDVFCGAYFGFHIWRLSLDNSISFYTPGLDVVELSYDMPSVISNYTSLGIRLGDNWTLRGGSVVSLIRKISKPHFGLKFSIEYSIGAESKSNKKPDYSNEYRDGYNTGFSNEDAFSKPVESQPQEAPATAEHETEETPAATEPTATETSAETETPADETPEATETAEPAEAESDESSETPEED